MEYLQFGAPRSRRNTDEVEQAQHRALQGEGAGMGPRQPDRALKFTVLGAEV